MTAVDWAGHVKEIQTVAAVILAVAAIGRLGVLPVYRFFKRMERGLLNVESMFQNNGGSSPADKWDRTEAKVDMVIDQLGIEVPDVLRTPTKEKKS